MGDARGKWEGDTLVVDTVSLGDKTWFDEAGNFHSDALKVVERFTPIDATHINYEATIDDAKVFTRPWKLSMIIYRRLEKNLELLDYECAEHVLREAVQGARRQTRRSGLAAPEREASREDVDRDCRSAACRAVSARHRQSAEPATARACGRGAAPASYPPYTRPASSLRPAADRRRPAGHLRLSTSRSRCLAASRRRWCRSRTAPRTAPTASSRTASTNVPKLPEGAIVRPVGVDPPDGKIPLTPEALARRKDIIANAGKIEYLDGRVLCLAPASRAAPFRRRSSAIRSLQKPGYVVIFYEQNHLYRTIPLDGRPPLDPNIRKAMGVSRGHWEGNVLVVEVTNFTNNLSNNWVIGAISATPGVPAESLTTGHGIPHSDLIPRDRALYADRRQHDPLRGQDRGSQGVHAAVDDRVLCLRARAEGLRAGRIRVLRGQRQEPAADDEHRHQRHSRQRCRELRVSAGSQVDEHETERSPWRVSGVMLAHRVDRRTSRVLRLNSIRTNRSCSRASAHESGLTNPHAWIYIDVKGPDGKVANWAIEMGPPSALLRRGWKKSSMQFGAIHQGRGVCRQERQGVRERHEHHDA